MLNKALGFVISIIMAGVLSVSAAAAASLEYIHSALAETYVSEYSLYEQILNNQVVFYTSVANGAVLTGSVVIELPTNLEATLEKDGVECEFVSGQAISEVGSYSMTVIANGSEMLGGKENERYYGLFRFRIMEKTYISSDEWEAMPEYTYQTEPVTTVPDVQEEAVSTDVTVNTPVAEAPEQTAQSTSASTTGSSAQAAATTPTEQPVAPEGDPSLIKAIGETDSVKLVTRAGTQIYTNIPKNAATGGNVYFNFTSDAAYELYLNGELIGYNSGEILSSVGDYRLLISDSSGLPAQFDFSIIGSYVRGVTSFDVPEGCVINQVMYDDYEIRSNGTSVDMGLEGSYTIDITYGEYNYTESITLDNTAPQFTLNGVEYNADSYAADGTLLPPSGVAKGGPVRLVYVSDDIAYYNVYLDGELISTNGTLTDYGDYYVRVFDHAGNYSDQTFTLIYVMDGMAIITVVILVALVAAAVAFVIISRKRLIIR